MRQASLIAALLKSMINGYSCQGQMQEFSIGGQIFKKKSSGALGLTHSQTPCLCKNEREHVPGESPSKSTPDSCLGYEIKKTVPLKMRIVE